MFSYCGNNPVGRRDDTGTCYTAGQIHNLVVKEICDKDQSKELVQNLMIKCFQIMIDYWGEQGIEAEVWLNN